MLQIFASIILDKSSRTPLYMQLFEKLKDMISEQLLAADSKLPSIRQLSELFQVNQVTIVSAYKLLESEGFVYLKTGSGTYVSNFLPVSPGLLNSDSTIIQDELYQQDDLSLISNGKIKIDENTINFASATPTPDLFPVEDFKVALNEVLERDKGNAFEYQDSQGFYPLRECISSILRNSSISCGAGDIQIISGAQQGIDLISKAFLKQGDYVITESPTYTGAIAVFKSRGAEIADIEINEDGLNPDILEYSMKKYRPRLIYIIPSFQNPTGYSYSNQRRLEIIKLAERYNSYIIEDDYVSDLDFEGKRYAPLKALDRYNRVIFIKSFSKLFMPGLRLGFMIAPPGLQRNILEAKHTTDISTSGLIQRSFDMYIRKGFWDNHFKFMYGVYRDRYLNMVSSLDSYLPDTVKCTKPGGGFNLWLEMPYGFPVNNLFNHCAANNIVFSPGRIFYSGNTPQKFNNIRLSFAAVLSEQIQDGIKDFCRAISLFEQKQEQYRHIPIL